VSRRGSKYLSEYLPQCSYEMGPDPLGRIWRCQEFAGHRGNHHLMASWLNGNPYEDVWVDGVLSDSPEASPLVSPESSDC
jgi:hypothetical protein